jgi:ribosome-binding protein aMBF1 (putative translation factor)
VRYLVERLRDARGAGGCHDWGDRMMRAFRNVTGSPDDPVTERGFEGLLSAMERGGMRMWERIFAEVCRDPYGETARLLAEEVVETLRGAGERELARSMLQRARRAWDLAAREEVARRQQAAVKRCGLSQRAFAARIGTSASRLNTYLKSGVTPGADLVVKAEKVADQAGVESSRESAPPSRATRQIDGPVRDAPPQPAPRRRR